MATEIEQDMDLVLQTLYMWSVGENDPRRGRYEVETKEMMDKTGLQYDRIVDAASLLTDQGLISSHVSLAGLRDLGPTPEGRTRFQQMLARKTEPAQASGSSQVRVFLSHSALDDDLAKDVKQLLDANDIPTFATPGSIPTGKWEPQIEDALQQAEFIYVLLTPNALRESVWVHHEYGYFYGYRHGKGEDARGHGSRFLYQEGTAFRGLYREVMGEKIETLEDPLVIAKAIAKKLGVEQVAIPKGFVHRKYRLPATPPITHPEWGRLSVSQNIQNLPPGTSRVELKIPATKEQIFHVSILTRHPEVNAAVVHTADVIGPDVRGEVVFDLKYRTQEPAESIVEAKDSFGRSFRIAPGPRAPSDTTVLLLTFETEDNRALAAAYYYTITPHSKGFPEFNLRTILPMDWREGRLQ